MLRGPPYFIVGTDPLFLLNVVGALTLLGEAAGDLLSGCRIDLFDHLPIAGTGTGDENCREETQQGYHEGQYPGPFFQDVGRLFNTHQLVAETTHVPCQSTPLGVLH